MSSSWQDQSLHTKIEVGLNAICEGRFFWRVPAGRIVLSRLMQTVRGTNMDLLTITKDNLETEHICCAIPGIYSIKHFP